MTEIDLREYLLSVTLYQSPPIPHVLSPHGKANNNLIGQIPPEIGNLNLLERIVLNDNCLIGTMQPEVGLMSSLRHIELNFNGMSGLIPDDFYNLPLEYVNLSDQVENEGYNCTSSDGSVVDIYYQLGDPDNAVNIGFQGKFLEQIGRLQNLRHLGLGWNSFSGSIASDVGNLQKLGKALFSDNVFFKSSTDVLTPLDCTRGARHTRE